MGNVKQSTKHAYDLLDKGQDQLREIWYPAVISDWRFYLGVAGIVILWGLFFVFRRRGCTNRLMYAGFAVMLLSSWLDEVGTLNGWWYYVYEVNPFIPAYLVWDFAVLPVTIMLTIQIFPNLNKYIKAVIYAAMTSFIGEPIASGLGVYVMEHWRYIYSFPIMAVIYLIADWLTRRNSGFNLLQK